MENNYAIHKKVDYTDIREIVESIGYRYADKIAYTYRNKASDKEYIEVSYEQMRDDVRALSTELISKGFAGKHIGLIGKLSYPWVLIYYSVLAIGSVLVPLDRDWGAEELADTMKNADIEHFFCETSLASKGAEISAILGCEPAINLEGEGENTVAELLAAGKEKFAQGDASYYQTIIDPDKLAMLVFTSGTTGKGKGVMLSQRNFISDMTEVVQFMDFTEKTIALLPPHHTYGSSVCILGENLIGVNSYISQGIRYTLKEIQEQKPGHLVLVPLYLETFHRKVLANIKEQGKEKAFNAMVKMSNTMLKMGVDVRRKLFKSVLNAFGGNLRMVISGGAYISPEIISFFNAIGISVLNGYGITECAPIISVNYSKNIVPKSVGTVLAIEEAKIADPDENGEGEICVKGPNVMMGYFKDEEATAAAFDEEGFFKTGDYGKLDENNNLYITGRLKNLIILSNGKNVYPEEIENEFASVPGILDIVVYEGQSKRGASHNAIVAEIYPDNDYLKKNGVEDASAYFQEFINNYNRNAIPYKKIGILKIRCEDFPKNTLRKIMRFKMDKTID